jgi:hypothetical protein
MSHSEIVDEGYRLRVSDLNGESIRVQIVNVSYQGLEQMTPVLHFAGQTRRLHLTQSQSRSLIEITGSATPSNWIGCTVELFPTHVGGVWSIEVVGPGQRRRLVQRLPKVSERVAGWLTALVSIGIGLLIATWYISMNYSAISATLEQLLP